MRALLTRFGALMHGGHVGAEDLAELEDKLYFDRDGTRDPYVRFAVLLVLSIIIATGGILADSTATVIGAMIVAPLMTPIMATGLSIVTGDRHHMGRSLAIVVIGAFTVVALSFAMSWVLPSIVDVSSNSQITGRISPRGLDMLVALACGAAGGFAVSRRSVSDALPGVAIAISLVPPLCVVGVTLSAGDMSAAGGALLLFITNMLAIVVAGGGLLAMMGYGAVARRGFTAEGRRKAAIVTGIAVVVVLVPLLAASRQVTQDALLEAAARSDTAAWIAGSGYETVSVVANGQLLTITIDGSGTLPSAQALAAAIQAAHPDVDMVLRVVDAQRIVVNAP